MLSHNSFDSQGRLAARAFYISVRLYLADLLLLEFEKIDHLIAVAKIGAVFHIPSLKVTRQRSVKKADRRNKLYRAQYIAVKEYIHNRYNEPNAQKESAKLINAAPSVHKAHYLFSHLLSHFLKLSYTDYTHNMFPILRFFISKNIFSSKN